MSLVFQFPSPRHRFNVALSKTTLLVLKLLRQSLRSDHEPSILRFVFFISAVMWRMGVLPSNMCPLRNNWLISLPNLCHGIRFAVYGIDCFIGLPIRSRSTRECEVVYAPMLTSPTLHLTLDSQDSSSFHTIHSSNLCSASSYVKCSVSSSVSNFITYE